MINTKSKRLLLILSIAIITLPMACSPANKNEIKEVAWVDTLDYGKADYDLMRENFGSDTLFSSALDEAIESGNTNAIKVKKLLATEYERRYESGMTEAEIDGAILEYYSRKKLLEKFQGINSRLPKEDADARRAKSDSIVNELEEFKKKLEKLSGQ